jgi:2-hydroxy-3-oxopropionate reductase
MEGNMKLGFIGLGIMGKPMAKNLINAGHELVVYDIIDASVDELVSAGASAVSSPKEVADLVSVIITMLPNSPHVKTVIAGENGILDGAKEGTLIIDMSSIAPTVSKEIFLDCAKKGVQLIDAPVSGGEPKAIDGTLSIMVGGDRNVFDEVKEPILEKLGSSVVHCGEIGAGNTTKLVNQIVVALNIATVAEAFTLAKKAGVDPSIVFDAIKGGLAGSTVMNAKVPMMIEKNYKPGFKVDLHIKDLTNALETGHASGSHLPLTALVMEMLQNLHADGDGQLDHSALAKYYEKITGTAIGE